MSIPEPTRPRSSPVRSRAVTIDLAALQRGPLQAVCSECGLAYWVDPQQDDTEWTCPQCGPSVPLGSHDRNRLWSIRRPRFRWQWRVPSSVLLVLLIPLLLTGFLWLEMHQLNGFKMPIRSALAYRPVDTGWADGARSDPDVRPAGSVPQRQIATTQADGPHPNPTDSLHSTADRADARPMTLSRVLRAAGSHQNQPLRFGCRFVRQQVDDGTWRVAASSDEDGQSSGGEGQPHHRLELVDAEGVSVAKVLVAAGSQAEQAVPWLLEGDYLEVVGSVAMQLHRPATQLRWGFLVREIHPANRPVGTATPAES